MIKWYTAHPKIVGNKAKGRISKRVFRENKARQIFLKTNISYSLTRTRSLSIPLENINVLFLYPLRFSDVFRGYRKRTYACQGVFSENLAYFVFLKHLFWDPLFCLIINEISIEILSCLSSAIINIYFKEDNNTFLFSSCNDSSYFIYSHKYITRAWRPKKVFRIMETSIFIISFSKCIYTLLWYATCFQAIKLYWA